MRFIRKNGRIIPIREKSLDTLKRTTLTGAGVGAAVGAVKGAADLGFVATGMNISRFNIFKAKLGAKFTPLVAELVKPILKRGLVRSVPKAIVVGSLAGGVIGAGVGAVAGAKYGLAKINELWKK